MKKNILYIIFFVYAFSSNAQKLTNSPYSRFGLGDTYIAGSVRNYAMGNIGIASDDAFTLNPLNPASYASLKLTTFDVGFFGEQSTLSTQSNDASRYSFGLSNISFGFPSNKNLSFALGLAPHSVIGYEYETTHEQVIDGNTETVKKEFNGKGGINSLLLGVATSLFHKKLSIGVNAKYLFGSINHLSKISLVSDDATEVGFGDQTNVNGWAFDLGIQFRDTLMKSKNSKTPIDTNMTNKQINKIKKKYDRILVGSFGLVASLPANVNLEREYFNYISGVVFDTLSTTTDKVSAPFKLGVGAQLSFPNHWTVALDFTTQNWSDFSFFDEKNAQFGNEYRIALGGEFIPEIFADRKKYLRKIAYRFGLTYEQSRLTLNSQPITSQSIFLGIGLPVRKVYSRVNIGVELGMRGTTAENLIQEQFVKMRFGFNINERWFIKRVFN